MEKRGLTELSAWLAAMVVVGAVSVVALIKGKDASALFVALGGISAAFGVRSIKGAVDRDQDRKNGKGTDHASK